MIKRFLLSVCIGFALILAYAERTTWAHTKIKELSHHLCVQLFQCCITIDRVECSLFKPSLTLHNLSICSLDGASWSLQSPTCQITSSWLYAWKQRCFPLTIALHECTIESVATDTSCAFIDYCEQRLESASSTPFDLQLCVYTHARLTIIDATRGGAISVKLNGRMHSKDKTSSHTIHITDMQATHKNIEYIKTATGTLTYIQSTKGNEALTEMRVQGTLFLPLVSRESSSLIRGIWRNGHGRFSLGDIHDSYSIDPIIVTQKKDHLLCTIPSARIPIDVMWRLIHGSNDTTRISGTSVCAATIQLGQQPVLSGCITIEQLGYHNILLASSTQIIGKWRDGIGHGTFSFLRPPECGGMGGTWEVHNDGSAYIQCENNGILHAPSGYGWVIMPRDIHCAFSRDCDGVMRALYTAHASHVHTRFTHDINGSLDIKNGFFMGRGSFDAGIYMLDGSYQPQIKLTNASYYDKQGICSARLSGALRQDTVTADLTMRFAWLRGLIRAVWGYDVQGDGQCTLHASYTRGVLQGSMALQDTHICIPGVNNFIHEITVQFMYNTLLNQIFLDECAITMHTGRIICAHASCAYDDAGAIAYISAPLVMNHCLVHPHNDVYATVSGHVYANYTQTSGYSLTGNCFLDRAYLKESPFSTDILKQLETQPVLPDTRKAEPVHIACTVESKEPIRIQTSHLHARALVDMRIKGTMKDPILAGGLKLVSGNLLFPYRSLSIIGGGMQFDPKNIYDPHIQLLAKDKVRSYMIGLHATGSVHHPEIILESWPTLTDEQIASLLLTGSEHEGLNIMMPSVITERINRMIFGKGPQESVFAGKLPLHIQVVPSFTNQKARGGLRAALEIDVGDKWHALIQKNFSLSEDTRVEIEYQATDDITVRAIRDERRDLSAEFEFRWKF